jgi:hypothetical protein
MLLGARSTKNAERGGLLALGGRFCMRGPGRRGGMGGIAGMFGYGRLKNSARVGVALAAELVDECPLPQMCPFHRHFRKGRNVG